MSDYIKREDVLSVLNEAAKEWKPEIGVGKGEYLRIRYKNLPAANVRENVRGEWERVDGFTGVEAFGFKETTVEGWSCSICGFEIDVSEKSFNYCPNCGADMRGIKDGKE